MMLMASNRLIFMYIYSHCVCLIFMYAYNLINVKYDDFVTISGYFVKSRNEITF